MTEAVRHRAEAILALPREEARIALARALNEPLNHREGTTQRNMALDFNAQLCTAIRVIAEQREIPSPWSRVGDSSE